MADALWITLIGMGLVFAAILLLWGLMALLVRLTAGQPANLPSAAELVESLQSVLCEVEPAEQELERRRQAAAVAVAVALALQTSGEQARHFRQGTGLSPWQIAHRAESLGRAGNLRKKVVVR